MDLIVTIIAAFLALVGAFTLINELSVRSKKPKLWLKFDEQKRTFMILCASLVFAPIKGSYSWMKKGRNKRATYALMELKTKITLCESMLENIIESKKAGAPVDLEIQLVKYLAVYGIRNTKPAEPGGKLVLTAPDWNSDLGVENGTMLRTSFEDLGDSIASWADSSREKFAYPYFLLTKVNNMKLMVEKLRYEFK